MTVSTRLLVRRHARSLWNVERRIQGGLRVPGLTREGVREARRWATALPDYRDVVAIWSSDAARTRQTAAPAARRFGLPVLAVPALSEVRAGVLEGCPHEEARREYPEAYGHWLARGDLDAVPGAETGDELQARCLAFVATAGRPNTANTGRHLVVTHAATTRSLVNTCLGRNRTTPVPVDHVDVHELAEPWERLGPRRMGAPWRPPIHRVVTADGHAYVVKDRAVLATALARVHDRVDAAIGAPRVLAYLADPRPGGTGVTVRRFVSGRTVPHQVTVAEEVGLWRFLAHVSRISSAIVTDAELALLPTLADRVRRALRHRDTEAARRLRQVTADNRVADLLAQRRAAADFDLHRDNVVMANQGLVKIDGDALCAGPATWPEAAALFGATVLYPSASPVHERPHATLLGASTHAAEVRVLVEVRLLLGLSFFLTGSRALAAAAEPYRVLYRRALTAIGEGAR